MAKIGYFYKYYMGQMIKRIFTLLCAIFVGLVASLWIVQNNSQIEVALSQKIISKLENMWGIEIKKESSYINFFTCSLYLKNGCITDPKKQNCHWSFKQCKIHISPLSFIFKKKINLYISFDNIVATSGFNSGNLDIADHLFAMFAEGVSDLNVVLKSIKVNNLDLHVFNNSKKIQLTIAGKFNANKLGSRKHKKYSWTGSLNISDAQVSLDNKIIARDISLRSVFYEPRVDPGWKVSLDAQIKNIPPTPKQIYLIQGGWSDDKQLVTIKNVNRTLDIKINKKSNLLDIVGGFDLNNFVNLINYFCKSKDDFVFESDLTGTCKIDANFQLDDLSFAPNSNVIISDVGYKEICGRELALHLIKGDSQKIAMQADLMVTSGIKFSGVCSWDLNVGRGFAKFFNSSKIKPLKNEFINLGFGDYAISPKGLILSTCFDGKNDFEGKYKIIINNRESDQSLDFNGNYKLNSNILNVKGLCGLDKYSFNLEMQPKLHFSKIKYQLKSDQIIDFRTSRRDDLILNGSLDYLFIKKFLSPSAKNFLLGHDCLFDIKIDQENLGKLHGEIALQKGSFYIPESQNLIQKFNSKFDFVFPGNLYLNDVKIGFFKGDISSPRVAIVFNRDLDISFLHLPLNFNDLLVNYKKDLLGIVYGSVLIKKDVDSGCKALGQVVLKRSLLKENIFAASDKYNFYGGWNSVLPSFKDFEFDLKLITEQPIKAKTSNLETNAALNLRITHKKGKGSGIINIPQLTGTVKLDGGFIKVLQNKLMIDYGKIDFVSNQMNDPIIDLIAKNRINKYMVSLQASGSLQQPTILVESTPELTEEQVLSLLLSGSEGYKLQTDLLALVEQNLYNVILGSKKILPESNNLLQKITRPLKYIQISPDFTDQSARGGIKGTININVNDQVKAQIQKNFNLQEDFSAQVEYMLSDDVNVKAIKDQRGELGAEVELRLKF